MARSCLNLERLQKYPAIFAGVFFLDQILKARSLAADDFQTNPDALLGVEAEPLLASLALALLLLTTFSSRRSDAGRRYNMPLALIASGIASNSYDRYAHGAVIDYLSIPDFCFFNLGDIAIALGTGLFIWRIIQE